jgi:hypothetical protein
MQTIITNTMKPFRQNMLHLCGAYNYVARLTQVAILLESSRRFHHIV